MSRCGPPGRTAAERNSSNTGTEQTPLSIDDARPGADAYLGEEAEAWIDQEWLRLKLAGTPVSRRTIRSRLVAKWEQEAHAQAVKDGEDEEYAPVLTIRRRHGSVPVDAAVGERVAREMAGRVA